MDMSRTYADIAKALEPYFDGLYHSDTRRLGWRIIAKVFHYEEAAASA